MGHARHFYIERCKRGHCRVEVIAQPDVDVADLGFGELEVAPHGQGLEELLYGYKESCDGRLDGRLKRVRSDGAISGD